MAIDKTKQAEQSEITVEERLRTLYQLQLIDSERDKIQTLRGELPLEVQDLEDEIAGLETRIHNYENEVKELENNISDKKNEIKEAESLVKKYQDQQMNVRNNREFDSLSKEIEYQKLEMELCNKRIKEFSFQVDEKKKQIEESTEELKERQEDINNKKKELEEIVAENQKEEQELEKKSEKYKETIEPRLLSAYKKIRSNARNGLAVVTVERDACGGCFNKIPPQRQLDIRSRKKIIVCEYCGRILVDDEIISSEENEV